MAAPVYDESPGFPMRVAMGQVPGWSFERKFGSIAAIQSAVEADVWEYGITVGAERYTFSSSADIDTISSSNGADTLEMTVVGLDTDGVETTLTPTLDGQNKVVLGTALRRVNRVYNSNGIDLVGDVYVYVDGDITSGVPDVKSTVRGFVSAGEGQTLQTVYTLPANKQGFFLSLSTSMTKGIGATAVTANLRGRTRELGKVFRTQDEFVLSSVGSSTLPKHFPVPLPFEPQTDFCPICNVSANGVGVSWEFSLLLRDV